MVPQFGLMDQLHLVIKCYRLQQNLCMKNYHFSKETGLVITADARIDNRKELSKLRFGR